MSKIIIILFFLMCGVSQVLAQETAPVESEKATVYVYSLATHTTLGRIKPSVFVDTKEVAQIRPNRFFVLYLEPGNHEIHFKKSKKRGGIEMEFKAGETYYLRVNWKAEGTVRAEGFDIMKIESARYDLKQLKPIDDDNIKDKNRVSTKLEDLQ
ncbi:MAG: DUF2846 domain-containing protein [Aridibacter sp.]